MTRRQRKTFYFNKTVEVEVDEEDLAEAGYHHEDACPAKRLPEPGSIGVTDALASLHRQAHPGASSEIFACPEEPCRSLGMDQIGYAGRSPAVTAAPVVTVKTGGLT